MYPAIDCTMLDKDASFNNDCEIVPASLLSFAFRIRRLKILCNISSAVGLLSLGRLRLPSSRAVFEFLGRLLDLQHVGLKPHGKRRCAILAGLCEMAGSRC